MVNSPGPFRFSTSALLVLVAFVAVLLAIWTNLIVPARHDVNSSLCSSNLYKIHHALSLYDAVNGALPPAYISGAHGKPYHSWRVLILPYLDSWGIDGERIQRAYSFSEPWNGPTNRGLPRPVSESRFACPCGSEQGTTLTSYVVIVGPDTLFPGTQAVSLSDVPESIDPILVIEITGSDIQWTEPRDLSIDSLSEATASNRIRLSKSHAGGFRYITASGKFGTLPPETTLDEIKRLTRVGAPRTQ